MKNCSTGPWTVQEALVKGTSTIQICVVGTRVNGTEKIIVAMCGKASADDQKESFANANLIVDMFNSRNKHDS